MNKIEQIESARRLVDFVRSFTEMQELQLNAIRGSIEKLVEHVMNSINDINKKTQQKAEEADQVLVTTCVNPDADTKLLLGVLQGEADAVFEKASGQRLEQYESSRKIADGVTQPDALANLAVEGKFRRMGGRFTKHMEALSTLDSELRDLLFGMMGALSGDDVIRQQLDHVIQGVESLSAALAGIVTHPESTFTTKAVDTIKGRVLTDLYTSYTSESEKEIFHRVFGKPVGVRKAS
jgi:hypothetical protein